MFWFKDNQKFNKLNKIDMHHKSTLRPPVDSFFIILMSQSERKVNWYFYIYFRVLSIRGLSSGSLWVASESDGEHAEHIAISGLHIDERLNGCLLLLDHRTKLVGGQVHAVKVGQAHFALCLLDDELELTESIFVLVQVAERGLEHAAFQAI